MDREWIVKRAKPSSVIYVIETMIKKKLRSLYLMNSLAERMPRN